MKKRIFSVLLVLALVLCFAAPASVSATNLEVGEGKTYTTIQAAIDAAGSSDTIIVDAGTYTEDLIIPDTKTGLTLVGTNATIKGVAMTPAAQFPTVAPNIDILADGVSISGFTIQGPEVTPGFYSSGICIGGSDVEIYGNDFEVTDTADGTGRDIGQAMQTYNQLAIPDVDVSGLNIHDNTFTSYGEGNVGFEGIYVNRDAGTGSISIADNEFSGAIVRAITTERSNVTIDGNSLTVDTGWAWTGVLVMDVGSSLLIDSVAVTGNTIEGFGNSIKIGDGAGADTLTSIAVSGNALDGKLLVRASAGGVTVVDNTLSIVEATVAAGALNATYNYWGQSSGPDAQVIGIVSVKPWLLSEGGVHYDLTMPLLAGWSIISPDLELSSWEVADAEIIYAYDGGGFTTSFNLDPVIPVFIKTAAGGGIGFNYVVDSQGIFTTDLEAGWNLIGIPETAAEPEDILSPIRLGVNNEVALATLASQGNYNPSPADSFYESMLNLGEFPDIDLYPFDGYWAYMNVAKEFGVIVVQ